VVGRARALADGGESPVEPVVVHREEAFGQLDAEDVVCA
jgi:hypothetical protein